jgi:GDSL/SGNH-like Acyl-Esterase family found in Pmr5 and Cas1p
MMPKIGIPQAAQRRCHVCIFLTVTLWSMHVPFYYSFASHRVFWTVATLDYPEEEARDKTDYVYAYENCLEKRGVNGSWILDWEYSKTAQYTTVGSQPKAVIANDVYRPSEAEPYRRATAFRWQEENPEIDEQCPISRPMQDGLDEFCRICQRLHVDRIWVAGDSLSEAFSHSLRAQLGYPKAAYLLKLIRPFTINCTNTNTGEIYRIQHRFDRIDDNFTKKLFHDPKYALHRQEFLTQNSTNGRLAIIVNVGVHLHSMEAYKESFHRIWDSLDQVLSKSKSTITKAPLIWFRNTNPGHSGCLPKDTGGPIKRSRVWRQPIDEMPFRNYQEYLPTQTNEYNWNLVPEFNEYAKQNLPNHVHYLNIYNMTVLRRDGHVGFGDCLHYYYPGPIDWWVHLWYSSLKDMAKAAPISSY